MYGLHANQHNLITIKLPLNYLELELGDIVGFDKLIQGRKMFGEDYRYSTMRNGQIIYPFFFITQIKKNLDYVEVKLYQLHYFDFENPAVLGCTDPTANNYNPTLGATIDDGSCTYTSGCMNPDALNYNSAATQEGACVFTTDLSPPIIDSPNDDDIIPLETYANDAVELITDTAKNSTFDDNSVETGVIVESGTGVIIASGIATPNYQGVTPYPGGLMIQILYGTYAAGYLTGYTLTNLTTGISGVITSNNNMAAFGGWAMIASEELSFTAGDLWEIVRSASNNSDWKGWRSDFVGEGSSYFVLLYEEVLSGNGNLTVNPTIEDGSVDIKSCGLNVGIQPVGDYTVSFEVIGDISGWDNQLFVIIFVDVNNWVVDSVMVESVGGGVVITHSISGNGSSNFDKILITSHAREIFTIDNVSIIKESTDTLQNPILDIEWQPSLNLLQQIPLLSNYTPSGKYLLQIYDPLNWAYSLTGNIPDGAVFFEQENIPATNTNMTLQIDFANTSIPQNTELGLRVTAIADLPDTGTHVFNNPEVYDDVNFSWGEIATNVIGDINADYVVNIADIVVLVSFVLGEVDLTPIQLSQGDVNGDGFVNVTDILLLVNMIMEEE